MATKAEASAAIASLLGANLHSIIEYGRYAQRAGFIPLSGTGPKHGKGIVHMDEHALAAFVAALGGEGPTSGGRAAATLLALRQVEDETTRRGDEHEGLQRTLSEIRQVKGATLGIWLANLIRRAADPAFRETIRKAFAGFTLRMSIEPSAAPYAELLWQAAHDSRALRFGLAGKAPELTSYHRVVVLPASLFILLGELAEDSLGKTGHSVAGRPC